MHVARCLLRAARCMLSSCMLSSTRVLCPTGTHKAMVGPIGITCSVCKCTRAHSRSTRSRSQSPDLHCDHERHSIITTLHITFPESCDARARTHDSAVWPYLDARLVGLLEENVLGLEIAVDDPLLPQEPQAHEQLDRKPAASNPRRTRCALWSI